MPASGTPTNEPPVLGEHDLWSAAWLFLVPPAGDGLVLAIAPQEEGTQQADRDPRRRHRAPLNDVRPARLVLSTVKRQHLEASRSLTLNGGARLGFADASIEAISVHRLDVLIGAGAWNTALLDEMVRVLRPNGSLYLDAKLEGPAWHEFSSWKALLKGLRHLRRRGLYLRQVFRVREADGQVYRVEPQFGSGNVLRDLRSPLAALFRGARVAVTVGGMGDTLMDRILDWALPGQAKQRNCAMELGSGRVLRMGTDTNVVRMPRGAEATQRCRNAFDTLSRLERLDLSFSTPRPVRSGLIEEQPAFVESRLGGSAIAYQRLSVDGLERVAQQAFRLISELHVKTRFEASFADNLIRKVIISPLESLRDSQFGRAIPDPLDAVAAALRVRLLDRGQQFVLAHGDFKVSNLIVDRRGNVAGLVDWDRSDPHGVPGADLIYYAAFDRTLTRGERFGPAMVEACASLFGQDAVCGYRATFGLGRFAWNLAGMLTLVRYIRGQIEGAERDKDWIADHRGALVTACARVLHETGDSVHGAVP